MSDKSEIKKAPQSDKVQVAARIDRAIIDRLDEFALSLGINRTSALSIALAGGLNFLEVIASPAEILNDPVVSQFIKSQSSNE